MQSYSHFRPFSLRHAASAWLLAASGLLSMLPAWGQEAPVAMDGAVLHVAMLPANATSAMVAVDAVPVGHDQEDGVFATVIARGERLDDQELSQKRGRMAMPAAIVTMPGMAVANGVTLWDELPSPTNPTPRPQQLSNGNVQMTRVSYSR